MARKAVTRSAANRWASPAAWILPLGVGMALVSVLALGPFTRQAVRNGERYTLTLEEIDCPAPPGSERAAFLTEVQYLAGMPNRLSVLDDELAAHLAEAFARHPWVEKVDRIVVQPPHQVQVQLRFRIPALAVQLSADAPRGRARNRSWPGSAKTDEPDWVVDGFGVVLPRTPRSEGLPVLVVDAGPLGGVGERWGAASVERAARTAGYLRPYQDRFKLTRLQATGDTLLLSTAAGTRIRWGHAPNAEASDEAPAAEKLQRLLDYCAQHGDLDQPAGRGDHDVRPPTADG